MLDSAFGRPYDTHSLVADDFGRRLANVSHVRPSQVTVSLSLSLFSLPASIIIILLSKLAYNNQIIIMSSKQHLIDMNLITIFIIIDKVTQSFWIIRKYQTLFISFCNSPKLILWGRYFSSYFQVLLKSSFSFYLHVLWRPEFRPFSVIKTAPAIRWFRDEKRRAFTRWWRSLFSPSLSASLRGSIRTMMIKASYFSKTLFFSPCKAANTLPPPTRLPVYCRLFWMLYQL